MEHIKEERMVQEFMMDNNKKRLKYAGSFQSVFGVSLGKFWSVLTGIDIVKFDEEFMKTPDGVSTEEFVKQKYGELGLSIVRGLL